MQPGRGNIILYQSEDGQAAVDVCLADETVWLTQSQMVELFQRDQSVISRHVNNEDNLPRPTTKQVTGEVLGLAGARKAITSLKQELLAKLEATELFGNERSDALAGIIGAIHQTFGGQEIYIRALRKRLRTFSTL